MIESIRLAQTNGARLADVCDLFGVSPRTIERYIAAGGGVDGRKHSARVPANRFTDDERAKTLATLALPTYRNLPPAKVVATLADRGEYVASERTMYRLLAQSDQLGHRGHAAPRRARVPNEHCARGANQVWSWDITYLKTRVRGSYYYAYVVVDIWSRMIIGAKVHIAENSVLSSELLAACCTNQGLNKASRPALVLHADNGSPMKGATLLATLEKLGVVPSFSRPRVSDDNAYSESLFRTLKHCPQFPSGGVFDSVEHAQMWLDSFVRWYNFEHQHSAIRYVTPSARHTGSEQTQLSQRASVFAAARTRHPERWTTVTRNWQPIGDVYLNRRAMRLDAIGAVTQQGKQATAAAKMR